MTSHQVDVLLPVYMLSSLVESFYHLQHCLATVDILPLSDYQGNRTRELIERLSSYAEGEGL